MRQFFRQFLRQFVAHQNGVTSIEYGLMAAALALAIMTAYFLAGESLETVFSTVASQIQQAQSDITE